MWPEVDEVLGPGQRWPGRLGDEDTDWLEVSGSARGPEWPGVDEVLGPGQWWPGRLGDEDPRMPMVPGPRWSEPLWVAFVQESLPGRASLERSG